MLQNKAKRGKHDSRRVTPQVVVVGSIGFDTIETPCERREHVLGGSVSYACLAARLYTCPGMVGVVGEDFSPNWIQKFARCGVDHSGLERRAGRTFRWSGVYEADLNCRRTLSTELNVFAEFNPALPEAYRCAPFLFLANIAPRLQQRVLDQVRAPRFVLVDTMDLWIETARDELREVIRRADALTLNESEARHLTGRASLPAAAAELRRWGPRWVLIKKGEHGSLLCSPRGFFFVPAYPLEVVVDPTGAGDTFAGGFIGYLAARGRVTEADVRRAMGLGSVIASFAVERFGVERLWTLRRNEVMARYRTLMRMVHPI